MTDLSNLAQVEWDIDAELSLLLEDIERTCSEDRVLVIRLARAAWWIGYVYALQEHPLGGFAESHGYAIPERGAA